MVKPHRWTRRLSFQISQFSEHFFIRIYLLVVLIDLSIFDPHDLVSIGEKVLSPLEVQRRLIELVLELTGPFGLFLKPELMLFDIALELLYGLLGIFVVSLFLMHLFDKLVVLGLIDPEKVFLVSSFFLLLLQLPLFVINAFVRGL